MEVIPHYGAIIRIERDISIFMRDLRKNMKRKNENAFDAKIKTVIFVIFL